MNKDIEKHIGGTKRHELPEHLYISYRKSVRLEWLTIIYLASVIVLLYLTMGSSAAMKTVWVDTLVGTSPAIVFLCASRIYNKASNSQYPYGYHKAFTVAFFAASVALLMVGLFVMVEASITLINREHPTIGSISLFEYNIWMGWLMILALLYSAIPAMFLGRVKIKLAKDLHEKVLYVDSQAQKADWQTGLAGVLGIIGIGSGLWWADAVAAVFISLNIIHDGVVRSRDSIRDLMAELPKTFDNRKVHPLVDKLVELCLAERWIKDARVRMREHGMVFFGDVCIIAESDSEITDNIERLRKSIYELDWKIQDVVISPVSHFEDSDTSLSGEESCLEPS